MNTPAFLNTPGSNSQRSCIPVPNFNNNFLLHPRNLSDGTKMAMDAAALAHKVYDLVTQELRLAPASGQRLPSPEDIRKILRGDNPLLVSHGTPHFALMLHDSISAHCFDALCVAFIRLDLGGILINSSPSHLGGDQALSSCATMRQVPNRGTL
jgi:hypothetical protein